MAVTEPAADLTLLLVHGIGRQTPGSVAGEVGNALLDWFQAHLAGSGRTIEVERALLKPRERGGDGPAEVTLLLRDASGAPAHRLRLVESLWAAEFDPPGFTLVLRWVIGPGTWLLFCHVINTPERTLRSWARLVPESAFVVIRGMVGIVAFFGLVLPMQLLGILLALLWIIPIPQIRKPLEMLVLAISEVIGDSYLFAHDPVARKAVADRVRRDLDALPAGLPVAILAHSQGAAVALDMLERHAQPPPFVTYGAGIRKLHELAGRRLGERRVPWIFYGLWAVSGVWIAAIAGIVLDIRRLLADTVVFNQWAGMSWLVIFTLVVAAHVLASDAADRRLEVDRTLGERIAALLAKQPAWLNLFASHDPVPAGPLVPETQAPSPPLVPAPAAVTSLEIVNGRDIVGDHTSYWANPDGFIDPVLQWLSGALSQSWLQPPRRPLPWWCRRPVRIRLHSLLSLVVTGEVVVLWWRTRDIWRDILPTAETIAGKVAGWLPDMLAAAAPLVTAVVGWSSQPILLGLTLGVHLAVLTVYQRLVPGPFWRGLNRQLALFPPAGPKSWIKAALRLIAVLSLYALAIVALTAAVGEASYAPLVNIPTDLLLDLHRWAFVGDLPAALDVPR